MKYEYPAVISYSTSDEVYYVEFPDISGCFTDGKTLREALDNAQDALRTMLSYYEFQGKATSVPSSLNSISLGIGEIAALIATETDDNKKIA
ncbi:MAG: type II toxin-antitoxin system HicB family antitoxin [Synergistaceae bacterium]|nr:type II toxin-antitoxin system HicB family antitoxin [Synergistaceae bacterium]